ncbi:MULTISPECIES: hemerythrin domain-containing protein [Catenuloplanes]|uniref:Hemerythrin-like domain-containing protein n=1 Tax=Catenuloplanes niger TaxID=587534 RepID=A0AAE3ZVB5_9ACTN|nr:hemerythrin domain-containing protein [Catenuloplanes niger]MDR7325325.1 hemerythrin-like domain-containing protein [Catenuloplanes niger]
MDAVEAIKQDHQRMEEIFARLEAGDGDRRELLTEVENRLEAHSHAEEQEVYPAIKKAAPDEADEVDHGYDEHAEAESLLHKAQSLVDSPDFDDALQEFLEAVRHHVNEEENEILPALADAVDDAELARLGEAFEAKRREELRDAGLDEDDEAHGTATDLDEISDAPAKPASGITAAGGDGASADLDEMTRAELYEEARRAEVPGRSHMSKDELKDALQHT